MKIRQNNTVYVPITIELEDRTEALALFNMIDKLEAFRVNANCEITHRDFSSAEVQLMIKLSNARSGNEVIV